MQTYLARLSSIERRFAVGVLAVVFLVLNLVFVWPRFGDWARVKKRLATAQETLKTRQNEIAQKEKYMKDVRDLERQTAPVPAEDQAVDFLGTVNVQAEQSGVVLQNSLRPSTSTNQFFLVRLQSFDVLGGEDQLVSFLYNLGVGNSMIRVRDLIIRPELPQRQQLRVTVKLEASYQKKAAARPSAPGAAAPAKPPTPTKR